LFDGVVETVDELGIFGGGGLEEQLIEMQGKEGVEGDEVCERDGSEESGEEEMESEWEEVNGEENDGLDVKKRGESESEYDNEDRSGSGFDEEIEMGN
jgi:hypothetical protein